jgi:hypothetical protein
VDGDVMEDEYELNEHERAAIAEIQKEANLQVNGILKLIAKSNNLTGNWTMDQSGKVLKKVG